MHQPSARLGSYARVHRQLTELAKELGLPLDSACARLEALAQSPLSGPSRTSAGRYSAINHDGVPFQWSFAIEAGTGRSQLGFITDVGHANMTLEERIVSGQDALCRLCREFPLAVGAFNETLKLLMPPVTELRQSIMAVCVASSITDPSALPKVYVHAGAGPVTERWARFRAAISHDRPWALGLMTRLQKHGALRPVYSAFDLQPDGLGRIKLYCSLVAPIDDAHLAEWADAMNKDYRIRLPLLRTIVDTSTFQPRWADVCLEIGTSCGSMGLKVDMNLCHLGISDCQAYSRLTKLYDITGTPTDDLIRVGKVLLNFELHERGPARHLLFISIALRGTRTVLTSYFHPFGADYG